MARNIEIKARISDLSLITSLINEIADSCPVRLEQEVTFFNCLNGRLKLRELSQCSGELILYHRPDVGGPKTSTYVMAATSEPGNMRRILTSVLGVTGRVRKRRSLYMVGRTRIHIDDVEGLGIFLELEVVLDDSDTIESGQNTAEELMTRLGIQQVDLIEGAYVDMHSVSNF